MQAKPTARGLDLKIREKQVLELLEDYSAQEIAPLLGLSRNYIYTIIGWLKLRFGVRTIPQIIREAKRLGYLHADNRFAGETEGKIAASR